MHDDHEHKENDQIPREQGDGDMLCDQAEHRRHAHRPDIGAGHLHAEMACDLSSPKYVGVEWMTHG